ncbi:MAG: hypothetical protein BAJALOKI2v1_80030 [Promethearchaeota archaeon]|nr:MAG: hypothetical protein BAJALOKI2v1_80030 [Candidatus Lokiarchaeota archaeon]
MDKCRIYLVTSFIKILFPNKTLDESLVSEEKQYKNKDLGPLEEICYVYLMYFDESKGHVPLLMFPDEKLKENKDFMRPIKYHPIWFLDVEEQEALDHIDLEFKGYTFFGKKFYTKSGRKKRRAGLDEETPETIVIIISLPEDLDIFGDELILKLTEVIKSKFGDKLKDVIECEISKEEIIKTKKIKDCIESGEKIREQMKKVLEKACKEYFSSVIRQKDSSSIKKQKAISFLALKGIDLTHILGEDVSFSNIKIFEPGKGNEARLDLRKPFEILNINIIEDSQELEILVRNNTEKEYDEIKVKITHVKEFFEKEIMNQTIEKWYPGEDLLFISPIIPHIDEYLFFLVEESNNQEKLLTQKIDINMLDKIES